MWESWNLEIIDQSMNKNQGARTLADEKNEVVIKQSLPWTLQKSEELGKWTEIAPE